MRAAEEHKEKNHIEEAVMLVLYRCKD